MTVGCGRMLIDFLIAIYLATKCVGEWIKWGLWISRWSNYKRIYTEEKDYEDERDVKRQRVGQEQTIQILLIWMLDLSTNRS